VRLREHCLSHGMLTALSRGAAGAEALRELTAARFSRDLVLLRAMVDLVARQRHGAAEAVAAAFHRLAQLERAAPAEVAAAVHYPSVSAWLLRTVRALRSTDPAGARPEFLTAVAAAAAIRGRVPVELDLTAATVADGGEILVTLPSVGTARLPAGPVRLRVSARGAELSGRDATITLPHRDPFRTGGSGRWAGVPVIAAEHLGHRLEVRLDGFDDFAGGGDLDRELMTGESRNESAVAGWRDRVATAWPLLVAHHGELAAEVAALISVLAPIQPADGRFAAATPDDAFGCVAMSPPRDATEFALNVAHEIQHVKLTAITDLFALTHESPDRFYAPWRAEPRPALAALHGVYAHLGVTAFWRRHRHVLTGAAAEHAHVQFARWGSAAAETGRDLLASERLTPPGAEFVAGVVRTLSSWMGDFVPLEAATIATKLNAEHRQSWQRRYGTAMIVRLPAEASGSEL